MLSERTYRLILGALLLVLLYFSQRPLIIALIALLFIEGLTNLRVPRVVSSLRGKMGRYGDPVTYVSLQPRARAPRFAFEAERAWRLVMGGVLLASYVLFPQQLWFLPWFLGFAVVGAGVSGICPALISLKLAGFK